MTIKLSEEEERLLIKIEALKYNKPNEDYFLDLLLKSKEFRAPVLSVVQIFKRTTKLKVNSKSYKFKLGKALEVFLEEIIKQYVHRHLVIMNVITNGITKYWIDKYEFYKDDIERELSYEKIMNDLDELLTNDIPKINDRLKNLDYISIKPKVELKLEPKVEPKVEPIVIKPIMKCRCSSNEFMCFCVDEDRNWIN
tara:strand:+ start:141 stop:728 length:588 start_codon:yes stop_codon:yes gene_type:complete